MRVKQHYNACNKNLLHGRDCSYGSKSIALLFLNTHITRGEKLKAKVTPNRRRRGRNTDTGKYEALEPFPAGANNLKASLINFAFPNSDPV